MNNLVSKRNVPKEISFNELLLDCNIGLSTVIIKKDILTNELQFPSLKTKEDLVLWLKISKKFKLIGLNKTLTKWRKQKTLYRLVFFKNYLMVIKFIIFI